MTIRIYLDTSVYNRPFDDQKQARIWLETLASSVIIQMVELGDVLLITSSVLAYENSRNPHELRRKWVNKITELAHFSQLADLDIKQRALDLEKQGLKAMDALHVSCAETAEVDYFVICDDRLIKRYQNISSPIKMSIISPTEFVRVITGV